MSRLGFGVRSAPNAEAALTIMRERRPSIVVLGAAELGAPDLTLLEKIKADPTLRETPVIVLGAPAGRERSITLGACEHMPKPIDHEALAAAAVRYADFNPIVGVSTSPKAARTSNAA
jgi:DNA-binding NtrC family response regulator